MTTEPISDWRALLEMTCVLTLAVAMCGPAAMAQKPRVLSISVCSPDGHGGPSTSCSLGTFDTQQIVLAPDGSGNPINTYAGGAISDEHSSVFPPGSLQDNSDYLFFVASGTHNGNPDVGVVVLSGGDGPDQNGQWTMDFASGYGYYPGYGFGSVFLAPVRQKHCPDVTYATQQDPTFDLDYAAAGSVVRDPTSHPGALLMFYEGTDDCFDNSGGKSQTLAHPDGSGVYITLGAATSLDYGRTWPLYSSTPTFSAVPLPFSNPYPITNLIQGPDAPYGAFATSVCMGNDCSTTPPAAYGRYAVLSPPLSLPDFMKTGQPLLDASGKPKILGDAEPSAFVDEFTPGPATYLYVVHGYAPGGLNGEPGGPPLGPNGPSQVLTISRAQLNGGTAPLSFAKWNGTAFAEPGIGGIEAPIFPAVLQNGPPSACEAADQSMHSGSISYVEVTQQYLLVFVCDSKGNPNPIPNELPDTHFGSSWFFSTSSDLSDPTQWSTPQEITGSWSTWDNSCPGPPAGPGPGNCTAPAYKGWYPTLMSLNHKPGRLTTSGYVFYLWGCQGECNAERQYSSRAFTITVGP